MPRVWRTSQGTGKNRLEPGINQKRKQDLGTKGLGILSSICVVRRGRL